MSHYKQKKKKTKAHYLTVLEKLGINFIISLSGRESR